MESSDFDIIKSTLGSILASIVGKSKKFYHQVKEKFKSNGTSKKDGKSFFLKMVVNFLVEKKFEKDNEAARDGEILFSGVWKRNLDADQELLFRLLIDHKKKYEMQEFMGILIPPCDYGHLNYLPIREFDLDEKLKEIWGQYFETIKENAVKKKNVAAFRRIIIYDKSILNTFCFDAERLKMLFEKNNLITNDERNDETSLGTWADYIRRYVMNVVVVHNSLTGHQDFIDTLYIDKSQFNSDEYFDLGIYKIDGNRMVYNPIYNKGRDKKVHTEKALIEKEGVENKNINEFDRIFEKYWNLAIGQKVAPDSVSYDKLNDFYSCYFKKEIGKESSLESSEIMKNFVDKTAYDFVVFDKSYIWLIKKIFREVYGQDPGSIVKPYHERYKYNNIQDQIQQVKNIDDKISKALELVHQFEINRLRSESKTQIFNFDIGWSLLFDHYGLVSSSQMHRDFTMSSYADKSFGNYNFPEYPALLEKFHAKYRMPIRILIYCNIPFSETRVYQFAIKRLSAYYKKIIEELMFGKTDEDAFSQWRNKNFNYDKAVVFCTNRLIVSEVLNPLSPTSSGIDKKMILHPFNVYGDYAVSQSIVHDFAHNSSPIAHLDIVTEPTRIKKFTKTFDEIWDASVDLNSHYITDVSKHGYREDIYENFIKSFHGIKVK